MGARVLDAPEIVLHHVTDAPPVSSVRIPIPIQTAPTWCLGKLINSVCDHTSSILNAKIPSPEEGPRLGYKAMCLAYRQNGLLLCAPLSLESR
jgi:hypothetical protein